MAVTFRGVLGTGSAFNAAVATIVVTGTAVAVGDLVVVQVGCDNVGAGVTVTVTDSGGNFYALVATRTIGVTDGDGVTVALYASQATTAVPTGGTIGVETSVQVPVLTTTAAGFLGAYLPPYGVGTAAGVGTGSNTGITTPTAGDLVFASVAYDSNVVPVGDSDTTGGAWSGMLTVAASTMRVCAQYKVPTTGDSQSHQLTWTGSFDYAAAIAVFPDTPPPPPPPGHVTIGGALYCVPAHGVAVRIEVRTPTQLLDVTDSVVRATWQQGGAYDAGRSPWYNPTPNPCELEITTTDPLWDPTKLGCYDVTPLATNVKIMLAEEATNGPGLWSPQVKFYGPLLAHTYEPSPGGGAVVQITAADALTNLGDMIVDERGEESPYDRLSWLASGVKDLDYGFSSTAGAGPILGRYHPDQGMTRLELMTDCALAAGQALLFQPTDIDAPLPHKTIVYDKPQGSFSNPGPCWPAAVDPELGMLWSGGDVPALGILTRTACLADIALARQEQGFRTRIRSARTIAPWTIATSSPGPIASLAPGSHLWQSPGFTARPGDRLEFRAESWEAPTWTGATPVVQAFVNPYAAPGAAPVAYQDFPLSGGSGTAVNIRYGYEVGPLNGSFVVGRHINNAVAVSIPASYHDAAVRLAGTGVEIETIIAPSETTYGQRAMTGWRSPIADQNDLVTWNSRALAWVPQPTVYPRLLRVATSPAHPSPGAQQWAVQLWAGQRLALRHRPNPSAPNAALINAWAVNVSTTLTPTEVTVDVECGPTTSGSS